MSAYRVTTSAGRAIYFVEHLIDGAWTQQSYRFPSRAEAQEWIDTQEVGA